MSTEWPVSILCPVDFSEPSAAALSFAGRLAQAVPSQLTVLHAHSWEAPAYFTESRVAGLAEEFRRSLTDAEHTLERYLKANCPGCAASTMVVDAPPLDAILDAARKLRTGLLVMGTHGRSGLNRMMLGSLTARVLHESAVPVLTLRGPVPNREPLLRTVLCAVDDSAVSRRALEAATRIATATGATLTVLHVAPSAGASASIQVCDSLTAEERSACRLQTLTRTGDAAQEILNAALEGSADLLVIGGRHRLFRDVTVLGATTIQVVRHSPAPVLTVFAASAERP
jgi:nucleotide-binding universal stress UspA family protein